MEFCYENALDSARRELRERRYGDALSSIREAMRCDMSSPAPHNLLGVYYELLGDVDSARKHYRAACDLDPAYVPSANNLERLVMWRVGHELSGPDLGESPCRKTS